MFPLLTTDKFVFLICICTSKDIQVIEKKTEYIILVSCYPRLVYNGNFLWVLLFFI